MRKEDARRGGPPTACHVNEWPAGGYLCRVRPPRRARGGQLLIKPRRECAVLTLIHSANLLINRKAQATRLQISVARAGGEVRTEDATSAEAAACEI
jgi:hypothetical protein